MLAAPLFAGGIYTRSLAIYIHIGRARLYDPTWFSCGQSSLASEVRAHVSLTTSTHGYEDAK